MAKIFLSYRRADSETIVGRIYDRLVARFGKDAIFKDVDSIPLGLDFKQYVGSVIRQCAVELVIIGPRWLDITDAKTGRRRLDDPKDNVLIEVESAIEAGIAIIPLLVERATMPEFERLPESLRPLRVRNGRPVRNDPDFNHDIGVVLAALEQYLHTVPGAGARPATGASTGTGTVRHDLPPPILPRERFPERLEYLGFVAEMRRDPSTLTLTPLIRPPLCPVPAGTFLMGSDPKQDKRAYDWEKPQITLDLPAYQIGKFPVTVAEYACFVAAGHAEPQKTRSGFDWPTQLKRLDHPVTCVTWYDARDYAAWLARITGQPWALPNEAEWEKAARWDPNGNGGRGLSRIYPWGQDFDANRCNTTESKIRTTTPVGQYGPEIPARDGSSPYGVQDMAGNVSEWTRTIYDRAAYSNKTFREDDDSTEARAVRGGAWNAVGGLARTTDRSSRGPGIFDALTGFRVVVRAEDRHSKGRGIFRIFTN